MKTTLTNFIDQLIDRSTPKYLPVVGGYVENYFALRGPKDEEAQRLRKKFTEKTLSYGLE